MTGSMCSAAGLRGDPLPGCRSHSRAESRFRPALCPVRVFEKMQVVADQSLKLKDIIHFHTAPLPNSAAAPKPMVMAEATTLDHVLWDFSRERFWLMA